ncbi:hypothetical protein FOA52_013662 [Chlamydomonas sp. UWO 241]|nr:hypothetical protein FOA52_013662 [Chlamydomonas sp. UWO 241]
MESVEGGAQLQRQCRLEQEQPAQQGTAEPQGRSQGMASSSSIYIGVSWKKSNSSWQVTLWDPQTKRLRCIGRYTSEEHAARAYDCAAVQVRGPGAKRNFPGEVISELPVSKGEKRRGRSSSRYIGVCWNKSRSAWDVQLLGVDPKTKRKQHIGHYAFEDDAARAYDCAAVLAHGPGAKRNFPGEVVSELPVTMGEARKERNSSCFVGVYWVKASSSWKARLWDPETKRERHIGYYASEDDAARAYDCAAVLAHGPGAKRNFPGEVIGELPVSMGEERKERSSSRYVGVSWNKSSSSWQVQLWDSQTKRKQHIGCCASEDNAARAYDCAAVLAHGPGAKRNFPGEVVSELPVTAGGQQTFERKERDSSRYIGVSWNKSSSSWQVTLWDPQTKHRRHIGTYACEEDAARAYDYAAAQARGPDAKRNFPDETAATSVPPVSRSSEEQCADRGAHDGGTTAQPAAVKVEEQHRSFTVVRVRSGGRHAVKDEPQPHAPAGPAVAAGAHGTAGSSLPQPPPDQVTPPGLEGQAAPESVSDLEWICQPP